MKKTLLIILLLIVFLTASLNGCIENNNNNNNDDDNSIKENKIYKFLFINIQCKYDNINGSLRYYDGDWIPDVFYPWDLSDKTLNIGKNKDIDKNNLSVILYYQYWINHAAYGNLFSKEPLKLIYKHELPYSENFSNPMDILFKQNFTKEINVNKASIVNVEILNKTEIRINENSVNENKLYRYNSSWIEYYSDYDPNVNIWYNATIEYSGFIEIIYYGEWEIKNIL